MADYTVSIALPAHKRGDRWPGIASIGPVTINGAPPEGVLTRVRMHLVSKGVVYRLDSDPVTTPDAPIVIDDAATWVAHIPPVDAFLANSGEWAWDMEFYREGQTGPLTLYGGTLSVGKDVTV